MKVEDSIKKVFKESWDIFSNQFVVLILGTLVGLLMMIFIITIPPMIFGIYYLCLQLVNGKKAKVSDVFKGFDYFFRSWGMFLVYVLCVLVGLILLIVPGLYLIVVWQYVIAISIMENKGVLDSLGKSYELGKNNLAFSIVFWILMFVVSSIGSVARVGILLTIPFSIIATIMAVKVLSKGGSKKKVKKRKK